MVWIPEGEFLMGSTGVNEKILGSETPQHSVYLDGYWTYKMEVTVSQYRKFCEATGLKYDWEVRKPEYGWLDNFPMVNVDWSESRAYCQWAGGDLPTEAQWEKAARGMDGGIYPWGDEWNPLRCVNSTGNQRSSPLEVGTYKKGASPYGVYDMAGNVWEWCRDWYEQCYYDDAPNNNPTGPASGQKRVMRGGSWRDTYPHVFRCAFRLFSTPGFSVNCTAFRCVQGR